MATTDMLERCLAERLETLTGFGTPSEKARKLESFLRRVDESGSGCIDYDEFLVALEQLNFVDCDARGLFQRYDTDGSGVLEIHEFADHFTGIAPEPIAINTRTKSVVNEIRARVAERGGLNGIRSIARTMRIMDDNGNKRLSYEEMLYGLQDFGIDLTSQEMDVVMKAFDRDGDGNVDFEEFLKVMRGKMSKRRRELVLLAFDILDIDKSGRVTTDELASHYDVTLHPDVVAGILTEEEALMEFSAVWDGTDRDGVVTRSEFLDYYADVSASIDTDDYFELVIRNAWHIAGGEGQYENTSNLRVLITYHDGSQEVVGLVDDRGIERNDIYAIKDALRAQGVDTSNIKSVSTRM